MSQLLARVALLLVLASSWTDGQVINLRDRENNPQFQFGRVTLRPNRQVNDNISLPKPPERFLAKPGNVIVHFDKQHEIQQLQYVLQDGRLATLYQRHQNHPNNARLPQHIPNAPDTVMVQRREESKHAEPAGNPPPTTSGQEERPKEPANQPLPSQHPPGVKGAEPAEHAPIDPSSTIEILDAKMNSVSKLVGDHLTLSVPELDGQAGKTGEDAEDEKLDILATIAVDAMAHVGEEKFKKASLLAEKIKSKVAAKLRDLPAIIDAKLKAKSSAGQAYLDHHGHIVKVEEEVGPAGPVATKHIEHRRLAPSQQVSYQSHRFDLSPQRLMDA